INDIYINAPITASGTTAHLVLNAANTIDINAIITTANTSGTSLTLNGATNANVNVADALRVKSIAGNAHSLNFNASQTWSTAPTMSLTTGDINVNAPLTWSSGTTTFGAANVTINKTLSGTALAFNTTGVVDIEAANVLNVSTISGTTGGFYIDAAQTWSA